VAEVERISSDDDAVRRLITGLGNPPRAAGLLLGGAPDGCELGRLLRTLGLAREVIAPSLISTAPGDRVETDRRDCRRLIPVYRADELVAIRVPTVAEEAVRSLCRARADMVIVRTPGPPPPGEVLVAPRTDLAGRGQLDARA
jgi:transposase